MIKFLAQDLNGYGRSHETQGSSGSTTTQHMLNLLFEPQSLLYMLFASPLLCQDKNLLRPDSLSRATD